MPPLLQMTGISKQFPRVLANDNVDFEVCKGEVHALVGENGAGKSTLMSILYGLHQPTSGEIFINGEKIDMHSPNVAISHGIGMVFQHFMLVPPLTVAENVVLGMEPKKGLFLDRVKIAQSVSKIAGQYGLVVDADARVEDIPVGMQQRVEIIKTLYRGAEMLVLDEPTAVLTPQEVGELFETIRSLCAQGRTVIFITHKLKEVLALSDRVTVMRQGKVVGTVQTKDTSERELARMMVGRDVLLRVDKKEAAPGNTALEVEDVCCMSHLGIPKLKHVSFSVREGEILGIAGVEGNGQGELLDVLIGARKVTQGRIRLKGEDITHEHTRRIRERSVAHIPDDRQAKGMVREFTVSENLILGYHYQKPFAKKGVLSEAAIQKHAVGSMDTFDIRPRQPEALGAALSGGNQQKMLIAREFHINPTLLVASQPTRGVDVGAIEFIHNRIVQLRDSGKAVVLISAELSEIMSLSDRIAVLYEGEIVGIVDAKTTTEEELGLMMAGAKTAKEGAAT